MIAALTTVLVLALAAPPVRGADAVGPPGGPAREAARPDRPAGPHENAGVRLEPGILDLGAMPVGESRSGTVLIRNLTDRPLKIDRVMPSCGCTTAPAPTEPIAPGEAAEIPITLRGGARQGVRLDKKVTVVAEGFAPVVLRVRAQVTEFIGIDPTLLMADPEAEEPTRVTLTAIDGAPFRIRGMSPSLVDGFPTEPAIEHVLLIDWARWSSAGSPVRIDLAIDHPEMNEVAILVRRPRAFFEEARDSGVDVHPLRGAEAEREPASRELTVLLVAARRGRVEAIATAIELGADINGAEPESGRTALHWAAAEGHVEVIEALLELGARLEVVDRLGRTPLALAAEAGRDDAGHALIERGAKVDHADLTGSTPLLLAASVGTAESVALLLEAGADPKLTDRNGMTPLHWAAGSGDPRAVMLLLEAGADPNATERLGGDTSLIRAARTGRLDTLEVLLGHRETSIDARNGLGMSALHLAATKSDAAHVRALADAGADLSVTCRRGWTALDHARRRLDDGRDEVVAELERLGAPSTR